MIFIAKILTRRNCMIDPIKLIVTPIRTAVTVNASKNADNMAAVKQNIKDKLILDLTFNNSW